jgi:hypothetical protein
MSERTKNRVPFTVNGTSKLFHVEGSPVATSRIHIPQFKSCGPFTTTTLPNGWAVALLDIDPDLATEMLQRNADNQRTRSDATVTRYAEDMRLGKWRLTHQGVAFDAAGHLHDGQHRLAAVLTSGVTVPFFVFFGAGGEAEMAVIDTNKARNLMDASKVLGHEFTKNDAALFNAMVRFGVRNGTGVIGRMTTSVRLALLDRNRAVLDKVGNWFGTSKLARKMAPAPVRAAVACASYHVDNAALERFAAVLTEQDDPKNGEDAAKVLRQWVTASADGATDMEAFLKTCRSVQYFLAGSAPGRDKLFACAANPFPPPESAYSLDAE